MSDIVITGYVIDTRTIQMTLHGTGSMKSCIGLIAVPEMLKCMIQQQRTAECYLTVQQVSLIHEGLL